MNIIISYLETMFSAYPQTPRLLEAKAELHGMMEDAYANLVAQGHSENEAVGQVIRDFGNLAEVAPELGITAELGAAAAPAAPATQTAPLAPEAPPRPQAPQHPPVTLDEARGYAEAQQRIRYRVAIAVALFVLSPAALIFLPPAATAGAVTLSAGTATMIGIFTLLVIVACGVMTLMSTARELAPYGRIEQGRFTPVAAVTQWAEELAQTHEPARIRALQISVLLWILSPAPLLAFAFLDDTVAQKQLWVLLGVVLILGIVAAGLLVLLPTAWAESVRHRLAHGQSRAAGSGPNADDFGEDEHSVVGVIAAFYWPLLTAIYLGWSFIGNAWGQSWIIWPVGAVLFGAIAAGGGAWESYRKNRRTP